MARKVLLVSAVLVGLVTLSSCRSLGELSEQKTYSSTPSCIFSDPILFVWYLPNSDTGLQHNTDTVLRFYTKHPKYTFPRNP
nr:unnamed protein product [Digitaria exilis]